MATANAAATLERADDFAADYTTATLTILDGATTLAAHTLAGFTTSNSGADGVATANAIADVTIAADGTADGAVLAVDYGLGTEKSYTLTLGTSGTDVIVSTTNYISGETSSINSFVVTFPA
jgi:hypothetical protein